MKQSHALILAAAIGLTLAGCKQQDDVATDTAANPEATPAAEAPATAPVVAAQPDALKADQVSFALVLEGEARVDTAKGVIEIPVKISNNGSAALSGKGNPAVNIGVHILCKDGGTEGALRDFSRTPLPVIEPGASATVLVNVPTDARAAGHKLKLDLVQEGVAWFSTYGQPTLEVGPFEFQGKPAASEVAADPNMRSL